MFNFVSWNENMALAWIHFHIIVFQPLLNLITIFEHSFPALKYKWAGKVWGAWLSILVFICRTCKGRKYSKKQKNKIRKQNTEWFNKQKQNEKIGWKVTGNGYKVVNNNQKVTSIEKFPIVQLHHRSNFWCWQW